MRGGLGESAPGSISSLGAVVSGTLLGFALTLLASVLLGLVVSLSDWEGFDRGADWFAYVCIALGGMLAARKSRKLGWLHGGLVGICYFLIATSLFESDFAWSDLARTPMVLKAVWSFAAGSAGGILGVNI